MMNFSVLMSIYHKEKSEYFDRCMQSIWSEQSVKSNEIVLVEDGKLTSALYEVIDKWEQKLDGILIRVPLEKNVGLADALNIGLKKCRFEIVARMDTDDIARSDRFEKQIAFMKSHPDIDVISSWVSEFENNENNIISTKKLPEKHNEIIIYAQSRCPINHPSAMYKKSVIQSVGSYLPAMQEDYYLWIRLLQQGYIFANIAENLVSMRSGYVLLGRRRGLKYAKEEFKLHFYFYKIGFVSLKKFLINSGARFFIRLLPISIIKKIYFILRS